MAFAPSALAPSVGIEVSEAQAIQPGDHPRLLCSDGLHGVVDDSTIASIVVQAEPPDAVQHLIDLATTTAASDERHRRVGQLGDWPISAGPDQNRIPVQAWAPSGRRRRPGRDRSGRRTVIDGGAQTHDAGAADPREAMNAAAPPDESLRAGPHHRFEEPAATAAAGAAGPRTFRSPVRTPPVAGRLIALGVAGALVVLAVIALIFSAGRSSRAGGRRRRAPWWRPRHQPPAPVCRQDRRARPATRAAPRRSPPARRLPVQGRIRERPPRRAPIRRPLSPA
ncbi:MAG: hypothetical protein U0531_19970 [Dehalococcoidia bacterium]